MMPTSFHRNWAAGIDGNAREGAAAIVLSGGYEDDKDLGEEIIYTGAGGNDPNSGKQIEDQTWTNRGNAGLLKSMNEGLPVRVIRGSTHKSDFSPKTGYQYAGLYTTSEFIVLDITYFHYFSQILISVKQSYILYLHLYYTNRRCIQLLPL